MSENYLYKLLKVAESEVGYLEKASNKDLDDKTKNAGSANYTKYSRDLVNWIGAPYAQGVYWCDQFVDWCFVKAFGKDEAKKLLGGWSAYTPTSAQYYDDIDCWHTSNPKIGDQIFFKNSQRINHTGIVYNVDNTKVYTIEGNTSSGSGVVSNGGCVTKKSYNLNNSKIAGYGRPKYDSVESSSVVISFSGVGIDVSKYQGNIDWNKVKSAGVEFAILKVIEKSGNAEPYFIKNYNGAKSAGINKIDVYNYSYATTPEMSKIEAQNVIKVLGDKKCVVWMDVEDKCQQGIGQKLIDIILSYKNVIESSGLEFGIYTGLSFYNSYLKPYYNQISDIQLWIARYGKNNGMFDESYKPDIANMKIWQYTSKCNNLSGINGNVDMNVSYDVKVQKAQKTGTVKLNSGTLNIREAPTTSSKILGKLYNGNKVNIKNYENGWYLIDQGYVCGDYITIN